jgi:hypothetical protein
LAYFTRISTWLRERANTMSCTPNGSMWRTSRRTSSTAGARSPISAWTMGGL